MYESRSRLKSHQQGELLKMFVVGATARAVAEVVGVHRNTAAVFFMPLRKLIASKLPSYELSGEVEADESYFGGIRKGKRGRGAAGKVAVFGLLKRSSKVYIPLSSQTQRQLHCFHHRRKSYPGQYRLHRHIQILQCS